MRRHGVRDCADSFYLKGAWPGEVSKELQTAEARRRRSAFMGEWGGRGS